MLESLLFDCGIIWLDATLRGTCAEELTANLLLLLSLGMRPTTNKLIENSRLPRRDGYLMTWPEFTVNFPVNLQNLETVAALTLNEDQKSGHCYKVTRR